jgi:hypothetical protein
MPTVKVPGIGQVEKKYVYIGGALVAGFVGYAYWSKSRASASEDVADYTTEDTSGTDYAYDSGVDEYENPGGSQQPVDEDRFLAPANDQEWSRQAIEKLGDIGFDKATVSSAIGAYFDKKQLSSIQADIIRQAQAILGHAPQKDYPINVSPTPTPTTPTAPKLTAPTGLSAHDIGTTTAGFLWNAVSGARWYTLHLSNGKSYNTASTHVSITHLKKNTTYKVQVQAVDVNKKPGPLSPTRTFKTHK